MEPSAFLRDGDVVSMVNSVHPVSYKETFVSEEPPFCRDYSVLILYISLYMLGLQES